MNPAFKRRPCPPTLNRIFPKLENSAVWKKRQEDVRENEWALYKKTLALLHEALDQRAARFYDKVTVDEIAVLVDAMLKLGSHALGIPYPATSVKAQEFINTASRGEMEANLHRACGEQTAPVVFSASPGNDPFPPGKELSVRDEKPPTSLATLPGAIVEAATKEKSQIGEPAAQTRPAPPEQPAVAIVNEIDRPKKKRLFGGVDFSKDSYAALSINALFR